MEPNFKVYVRSAREKNMSMSLTNQFDSCASFYTFLTHCAIAVEECGISLNLSYCVYNPTLKARMNKILQTPSRRLTNVRSNYLIMHYFCANKWGNCLSTRVPHSPHCTNWWYILLINKNYTYTCYSSNPFAQIIFCSLLIPHTHLCRSAREFKYK